MYNSMKISRLRQSLLAGLSKQVNKIFGEHVKENQPDMKLQALTDIHLRSNYQN